MSANGAVLILNKTCTHVWKMQGRVGVDLVGQADILVQLDHALRKAEQNCCPRLKNTAEWVLQMVPSHYRSKALEILIHYLMQGYSS